MLLIIILQGCNVSKHAMAPPGMTPKRKNLDQDTYGGYIRLLTLSNQNINGEFLGIRQDSLVVWDGAIKTVHRNQISQGKIYVFEYNSYGVYMIPALIPNIALLYHIPEFGAGPFVMAGLFSGIILLGGGSADLTELKKQNYFDWNEERQEFLKYARFPHGIPPDISLDELVGKTFIENNLRPW